MFKISGWPSSSNLFSRSNLSNITTKNRQVAFFFKWQFYESNFKSSRLLWKKISLVKNVRIVIFFVQVPRLIAKKKKNNKKKKSARICKNTSNNVFFRIQSQEIFSSVHNGNLMYLSELLRYFNFFVVELSKKYFAILVYED